MTAARRTINAPRSETARMIGSEAKWIMPRVDRRISFRASGATGRGPQRAKFSHAIVLGGAHIPQLGSSTERSACYDC